jgi:hypothetical protein
VDALRQKGAELLKRSPCFQALVGPAPVRAAGASTLCP